MKVGVGWKNSICVTSLTNDPLLDVPSWSQELMYSHGTPQSGSCIDHPNLWSHPPECQSADFACGADHCKPISKSGQSSGGDSLRLKLCYLNLELGRKAKSRGPKKLKFIGPNLTIRPNFIYNRLINGLLCFVGYNRLLLYCTKHLILC